jgi:hypothetical protein
MKNDEVYEPAFLRHSVFMIRYSIFFYCQGRGKTGGLPARRRLIRVFLKREEGSETGENVLNGLDQKKMKRKEKK